MKHVKKSVLLPYTPQQMHRLVATVEDYPGFLPWCARAEVLQRHDDGVTARLHLNYRGVRQSFTTRNREVAAESVHVQLVDGPFSVLDGTWLFKPIGQPGMPPEACRVDFDLRYAFAGFALDTLLGPVFDGVANNLVEAFVKRAEAVHGRP